MGNAYWYLTEPIRCYRNGCNGTLYTEELIYSKKGWTNRIRIKHCNKCNAIFISKSDYEVKKKILKKFGITKVKDINLLLDKNLNPQNSNLQINQKDMPTETTQRSMKNEKIVETVKNAIMKDVFTDINPEKCVIDIFLQNQNEFNKRTGNINKVSLNFLNKCKGQLKEESDRGKILFFRKYNYEKILNDYLSKTYNVDILKISFLSGNQENQEISDQETLVQEDWQQHLKRENESREIKPLQIEEKDRQVPISKNELKKVEKQKKQEQRTIVEQEVLSNINNITWTKLIGGIYVIYEGIFRGKKVEFRIDDTVMRKNPSAAYMFKYDNKAIQYIEYKAENIEEAIKKTNPKIKKKKLIVVINKNLTSKKKSAKKTSAEKNDPKKKEEIAKRNAELEKQRQLKEERRRLHEERIRAQQEAKRLKELERQKNLALKEKEQQEMLRQLPQIGVKDFVVRRAVFKCMHSKHEVIDLAAAVRVVDDNGKEKLVKVSAGYCKVCKVYFIMESTYEKLRNMGVVLCRICDEKSYMKNSFVNGMKLAQESILMQFGYTVSQTEGLSATRRQKILAVIIDNHILSKSEIISYLDFFISQRQYQSKFEIAVSKWETDREFVQEYKIGEYTQFGVNAIYRR